MSGEWLDHHGRAVNDSHAEVLARRAFVAHLLARLACLVDALDAAHSERAAAGASDSDASARVQQLLADSWFEPVPVPNRQLAAGTNESESASYCAAAESASSATSSCSTGPQFRLKGDVRVHLYVSSTPCGDARVFCTGPSELDVVDADEGPVSLPLALESDQHSLRKSRGKHSPALTI